MEKTGRTYTKIIKQLVDNNVFIQLQRPSTYKYKPHQVLL